MGIANPVALHPPTCNLGGGLLIIVDLFVVVDNGVSSINKLAGADERIVGEGGNKVCTLGGLPYVVKEFDDSGSHCSGPVGEMEYYLGRNTGGDEHSFTHWIGWKGFN
jgi:hypothetical protein